MKTHKFLRAYASNKQKILITLCFLLISITLSGCINGPTKPAEWYYFSFEEDMQGWQMDGTDLGDPPINWSITRTDELFHDGYFSIKLYLNNLNDAGKIWMENIFNLQPNTLYKVSVSYLFATRDFGAVNLFRIITGVSTHSPETADDLIYQGNTGHHQDEQTEYIWLDKQYSFTIQTDVDGALFVFIGVWGTWETARTYYIDSVNISFTQVLPDKTPDINGKWALNYYDWTCNLTKQGEVILERTGFKMTLSTKFIYNHRNSLQRKL